MFITILLIAVFCAWFIPVNIYSTNHHDYYYDGDLSHEQQCQLYDMVEDSNLVRDYIDLWRRGEGSEEYTIIEFSTRTYDHDHLKKALKDLDFKLYSTKDALLEYQCKQKGPEYEIRFDGRCMECG